MTHDLEIIQRVVHVGRYERSFNANHLVHAVVSVLQDVKADRGDASARRIIRPSTVIGFQRDRASVNTAAVRMLLDVYIGSLDLECMAHTLCHPGEHFQFTFLDKFKQDLCGLAQSSYGFKKHWKTTLQESFKQPGNTRWWATFELFAVLKKKWDLVIECIKTASTAQNISEEGARLRNLTEAVTNPQRVAWLELEVATVVIVAEPLVRATYILEGDGPCAIVAFDIVNDLLIWFQYHVQPLSFPALTDAMEKCVFKLGLIEAVPAVEKSMEFVRGRVTKSIEKVILYFHDRIFVKLQEDVAL